MAKQLKSGSKTGKRASVVVHTYSSPAAVRGAAESAADAAGLIGKHRALVIETAVICESHAKASRDAGRRIVLLMAAAFGGTATRVRKPKYADWAPVVAAVRKVSEYSAQVLRKIGRGQWKTLPSAGTGTGKGTKGQNTLKTLRGLSSKLENIVKYASKKGFEPTCPQDVYRRFVALAKEAAELRKLVEQRKEEEIETRDAA